MWKYSKQQTDQLQNIKCQLLEKHCNWYKSYVYVFLFCRNNVTITLTSMWFNKNKIIYICQAQKTIKRISDYLYEKSSIKEKSCFLVC